MSGNCKTARAAERLPSFAGESDTESVEVVSELDVEEEVLEPTAVVESMAFESQANSILPVWMTWI